MRSTSMHYLVSTIRLILISPLFDVDAFGRRLCASSQVSRPTLSASTGKASHSGRVVAEHDAVFLRRLGLRR
jgi:hypothetical protein